MSSTLTTVATTAAQILAAIDSGQSLSSTQLADILALTNNWLDNLSSEELFIIQTSRISWPTVAATQSYTIGTAQVINVTRPMAFLGASTILTSGPGNPVKILTVKEWEAIDDRQRQSWKLEGLFYDRGFPTGIVYLAPVPLGIYTVEAQVWSALTQFADATTPITIPPGYLRFLEHGVAREIAGYFNKSIPASVDQNFADAAARVRKLNASLMGEIPPEAAA